MALDDGVVDSRADYNRDKPWSYLHLMANSAEVASLEIAMLYYAGLSE